MNKIHISDFTDQYISGLKIEKDQEAHLRLFSEQIGEQMGLLVTDLIAEIMALILTSRSQMPTISTISTISSPTPAPILAPTATTKPVPTSVPKADAVLTSAGFVHHPELYGVDTCRVVDCMVYESVTDGINAWVYLDGSLGLLINTWDQYDLTKQENTISRVITQLFGEAVYAWISDHRTAAMSAPQNGDVGGCNITIAFTDSLGMKLTVISIVRGGTGT